ncbi:tyrosine-type recombinase/integrase [Candidatus Accumulibacter contiguus]|jgi:integrase/recombinase XerD|uniref:tyrosine-type recombinase/integrase n=1 Tax=Candidatus Accumulibacter contiguus TaxID=2954381 RepID=UPI002FC3165D
MSELRERMSNTMCLRGMAARTQEAYIGALVELAKYSHRSPADLRVEEVQAYLLHWIRDKKLAYASVNQASCAFRFLYRRVLGRPEAGLDIPMAKVPKRLPQILSREEVARLIDSARTLRGRTLLMTTYAAGLRVSEVCALQVGDIESAADRMCLKVRQGKGGKDRYTLLSPRLLAALRAYWRDTRPRLWWFPNRAGTDPIEIQTAQRIDYAARHAAGIAPEGGIHGLRHAFATHLLEAGVDLYRIGRLLGQGPLSTTSRDLHLARSKLTGNPSPLELLDPHRWATASDSGRGLPPARAGVPRQAGLVVSQGQSLAGHRRLSHGPPRRPRRDR